MSNFITMKTDMNLLGMASLIGQDMGALLNKCQREEVESYPWSFLFQEVVINAIGPISANATVNQGTNVVTFSGGFNPLSAGVLPGWFIWLGPTLTVPFIIAQVTSNSVILTSLFQLPTQIDLPSNIQPLYYSVFPLQTIFRIRQIDLLIETSRAELDGIDPSRIATGGSPSLRWANAPFIPQLASFVISGIGPGPGTPTVTLAFPASTITAGDSVVISGNSLPLFNAQFTVSSVLSPTQITLSGGFPAHLASQGGILVDLSSPIITMLQAELWPRPQSGLPYIVDGKIGAIDMVADTDLPMIPSQVLEAKAMMYACRAIFASSGNPKWMQMSESYKADYTTELEKAKTEDSKRIIPKGITSWGGRRLFDAAIDYNHDLAGPPGGFAEWT